MGEKIFYTRFLDFRSRFTCRKAQRGGEELIVQLVDNPKLTLGQFLTLYTLLARRIPHTDPATPYVSRVPPNFSLITRWLS